MKKIIRLSFVMILANATMYAKCAYGDDSNFLNSFGTGSPNIGSDVQLISYNVVKGKDDVCYYCGSSGTDTRCSDNIGISGMNTAISSNVIAICTGGQVCVVSANGFYFEVPSGDLAGNIYYIVSVNLPDKHGEYFIQNPTSVCNVGGGIKIHNNGLPFCMCSSLLTSGGLAPTHCYDGYYKTTNGCAICPSMVDIHGITRYGTGGARNTGGINTCKMSSSYTFNDVTGDYNFTQDCAYAQ
jgi:hypothetical protein